MILVFEVEDHCDTLVFIWSYDFGGVKSSGIARPLLVFFYRFLGVAHFRVVNP